MADFEKHPKASVSSIEEKIEDARYAREELLDPAKEETLHRGLSARQISMIAVSRVELP